MSYRMIAAKLGVSFKTVQRRLDPTVVERERAYIPDLTKTTENKRRFQQRCNSKAKPPSVAIEIPLPLFTSASALEGRKQRKWTVEEQQYAERLREQGLSYSAIGRIMGRTHSIVQIHLNPACHQRHLDRQAHYRKANPDKVKESNRRAGRNYRLSTAGASAMNKRREQMKKAKLNALLVASPVEIRRQFFLFENVCAYCGFDESLQIDHVVPVSLGGTHEPSNIVPACSSCNSSKNANPVEEWYLSQPFYSRERWNKIQAYCPSAAGKRRHLALVA